MSATSEVRAMYFPKKAQNEDAFKISFYGAMKFKYNTNYIMPSDFIRLNTKDLT